MATKQLFQQDAQTKETLNKISALFGVSPNLVKEVWEYTIYVWLVQLLDDPDKLHSFTVPYLGTIGIKFKDEFVDSDSQLKTNCEAFLSVSQNFKDLIGDVYNNKIIDILQFLEDNKIQKTIELIQTDTEL